MGALSSYTSSSDNLKGSGKRKFTSGQSAPSGSQWHIVDSQFGKIDWSTVDNWLTRTPFTSSDNLHYYVMSRGDNLRTVYAAKM